MGLTNYSKQKFLEHVLGIAYFPVPPNLYLALGTAEDDTGLTSEITGLSYERELIEDWSNASGRSISNSKQVTFEPFSGPVSGITHFGVYDAAINGNCLFTGEIANVVSFDTGDSAVFDVGELKISFQYNTKAGWSDYLVHALLDHVFNNRVYTPENLYIGFSGNSLDYNDPITGEPTQGGYSRQPCNSWKSIGAYTYANDGDINFTVSNDWGTVVKNLFISNSSTLSAPENVLFFDDIISTEVFIGDKVIIYDSEGVIGLLTSEEVILSDSVQVLDELLIQCSYNVEVTDTVSFSDDISFDFSITDVVYTSDTIISSMSCQLEDTVSVEDSINFDFVLTDTLSFQDLIEVSDNLFDTVNVNDSLKANETSILEDTVSVSDELIFSFNVNLFDNVAVSDTIEFEKVERGFGRGGFGNKGFGV